MTNRPEVLRALQGLDPHIGPQCRSAGLTPGELASLSKQYEFHALAAMFPSRGNESSLRRIAWFGSAITDIGRCAESRASLVDGALFNLGIALFDSVIDVQHDAGPSLACSINGRTVAASMMHGVRLPTPAGSDLLGVARLFDDSFRRTHARFRNDLPARQVLAGQLREMYESETMKGANRERAKTGPVDYLWRLDANLSRTALVQELCWIVALLDDWNDLEADLIADSANYFLTGYSTSTMVTARHVLLAVRGLLWRPAMTRRVIETLEERLYDLIYHMNQEPDARRAKIALFLRTLLGTGPDIDYEST